MIKRKRTKAAARAEAEKRARMLRLAREIGLSSTNEENCRRAWRETLLRVKMPDIRGTVEIGWQTFMRALDLKDHRIGFLLDALWEAEEQHALNAKSHAEIIDRLLRGYEDRLRTGFRGFRENVGAVHEQSKDEIGRTMWENDRSEMLLRAIGLAVNDRLEDSANNARSNAISKVDAFVEDAKDERATAATRLENRLSELTRQLRVILSNYRTATQDRRKQCESIREKDEKERRQISRHWARAASLLHEIETLRQKIGAYQLFKAEQLRQITIESEFFRNALQRRKSRFAQEMKKDKKSIATVSTECNRTTRKLNGLIKKGGQILKMMQMCRKYETQDEKIIGFQSRHHLKESGLDSAEDASSVSLDPGKDFHYATMSVFWERVGAMEIIAGELRGERDELRSRMRALRKECKERLEQSKKG